MTNLEKYIRRYANHILQGAPEEVLSAMHELQNAMLLESGFVDGEYCRRTVIEWFDGLDLCTHFNHTTGEFIAGMADAMAEAEQGCTVYPVDQRYLRNAILGEAAGHVSVH